MTRSIGPMWGLKSIVSLRPTAASRWSAPSRLEGRGFNVAPFPSSAMSLGLGIPWQVALQQSLPPLSQPGPLCNDKGSSVEQFSADGTCLTDSVSQKGPQSTWNDFFRSPSLFPIPHRKLHRPVTLLSASRHHPREHVDHVPRTALRPNRRQRVLHRSVLTH